MNYIILLLEFIVLTISIGLFIAKRVDTPGGPSYDINWNIALIISAILLLAANAALVCRGVICFFTCGDESVQVTEAKNAVARYRRVKAGQSAKPGLFGYGSVDLNHLEDDPDEANLFVGIDDPVEIKNIADAATKSWQKNRAAQRSNLIQQRTNARVGEQDTNLARRNLFAEGATRPVVTGPTQPTQPQLGYAARLENALKQGDAFSRDLFHATQAKPKPTQKDVEQEQRRLNPSLFSDSGSSTDSEASLR